MSDDFPLTSRFLPDPTEPSGPRERRILVPHATITEDTRLRSSLIAATAPLNVIFPSTALRRLEHHRCFSCICRKCGPR
jgi:hypothetical protein